MKKICEIDSVEAYSRGATATVWHSTWKGRRRINPEWIEQALKPAQLQFIENKRPVFRPHPRHSPTIELFVDEHDLTNRDWTVIRLLF